MRISGLQEGVLAGKRVQVLSLVRARREAPSHEGEARSDAQQRVLDGSDFPMHRHRSRGDNHPGYFMYRLGLCTAGPVFGNDLMLLPIFERCYEPTLHPRSAVSADGVEECWLCSLADGSP